VEYEIGELEKLRPLEGKRRFVAELRKGTLTSYGSGSSGDEDIRVQVDGSKEKISLDGFAPSRM
jgi:hypothetical protein